MRYYKEILVLVAAVVVIILLLVLLFRKKRLYGKYESVMSDAENYFYYLIKEFLPASYDIIPQVSLATCFKVLKSKNATSARNRILSKRFDYAIVKHNRLKEFPYRILDLMFVIELDDNSHKRKDRMKRDEFVEKICKEANLPILRYICKPNAHPDYDKKQIHSDIHCLIKAIEKKQI